MPNTMFNNSYSPIDLLNRDSSLLSVILPKDEGNYLLLNFTFHEQNDYELILRKTYQAEEKYISKIGTGEYEFASDKYYQEINRRKSLETATKKITEEDIKNELDEKGYAVLYSFNINEQQVKMLIKRYKQGFFNNQNWKHHLVAKEITSLNGITNITYYALENGAKPDKVLFSEFFVKLVNLTRKKIFTREEILELERKKRIAMQQQGN